MIRCVTSRPVPKPTVLALRSVPSSHPGNPLPRTCETQLKSTFSASHEIMLSEKPFRLHFRTFETYWSGWLAKYQVAAHKELETEDFPGLGRIWTPTLPAAIAYRYKAAKIWPPVARKPIRKTGYYIRRNCQFCILQLTVLMLNECEVFLFKHFAYFSNTYSINHSEWSKKYPIRILLLRGLNWAFACYSALSFHQLSLQLSFPNSRIFFQ